MTLPIAWTGRIESISQEGLGVGTIKTVQNGHNVKRPIFVPFTVPGDEVEADILEQKRKYSFGQLKTIIASSPKRVTPPCPHFGVCGGCNLEHIDYDEQLRQKAQQIQFLLTRKGVRLPRCVKVLAARQRHNYRRRAKIALRFSGKDITAGFRKFHAHDIVQVKTCFIVAKEIVELISILNNTESSIGMADSVEIELIVVVGDSKKLGLLVTLDDIAPQQQRQVKEFFEELYGRNRKLIGNLFFEENRTTKTSGQVQEHITYKAGGITFSFLPQTFIQSNIAANETLIATATEFLFRDRDAGECVVLDLYAGIGNISLPVAKKAKSVVAVEGHEASVLLGRINAYQNGLDNVLFLHRSTEKYLYEYVGMLRAGKPDDEYREADVAIIDPPRTGCTPEAVKSLLFTGLPRILYISCNPVTLAVDLALLSEKYAISDIVAIDMFPDISHVETLVLLDKKA